MEQTVEKKPRKKRATKPSLKQKRVAKRVVNNLLSPRPVSLGQILREEGYGRVSESPARIVESEGFKAAIDELGLKKALFKQGINPDKIARKIDVLLEARDRLDRDDYTAIDKGLKHATAIFGIIQDKPPESNKNTYNFVFSTEVREKVREMEDQIKSILIKSHVETPEENVESQPEGFRDSQQSDGGANQSNS